MTKIHEGFVSSAMAIMAATMLAQYYANQGYLVTLYLCTEVSAFQLSVHYDGMPCPEFPEFLNPSSFEDKSYPDGNGGRVMVRRMFFEVAKGKEAGL